MLQARKLMKVRDAAAYVGLPASSLKYLIHEGRGPARYELPGKTFLYDAADLDTWEKPKGFTSRARVQPPKATLPKEPADTYRERVLAAAAALPSLPPPPDDDSDLQEPDFSKIEQMSTEERYERLLANLETAYRQLSETPTKGALRRIEAMEYDKTYFRWWCGY